MVRFCIPKPKSKKSKSAKESHKFKSPTKTQCFTSTKKASNVFAVPVKGRGLDGPYTETTRTAPIGASHHSVYLSDVRLHAVTERPANLHDAPTTTVSSKVSKWLMDCSVYGQPGDGRAADGRPDGRLQHHPSCLHRVPLPHQPHYSPPIMRASATEHMICPHQQARQVAMNQVVHQTRQASSVYEPTLLAQRRQQLQHQHHASTLHLVPYGSLQGHHRLSSQHPRTGAHSVHQFPHHYGTGSQAASFPKPVLPWGRAHSTDCLSCDDSSCLSSIYQESSSVVSSSMYTDDTEECSYTTLAVL